MAMIALVVEAPGAGSIHHIVVQPEWRGRGLGSALIRDGERQLGLSRISAETDRDAVAFYERTGFQVTNLGEKYPGVERFYCTRHSPFR
jgi:ribosomal protein S18 acetylase RimI-like enzyme